MNKYFYSKLALTNINKHRKNYIPYILTCIFTIAMFYIMHFLSLNPGLNEMSGGDSLKSILSLGTVVIGIFAAIFLFYTNSFLIKQRKKEFGLFNILGMEKKHIARVITWESLFVAATSLTLGLLSGIVLGKLMFLLLNYLLHFTVPLTFLISYKSILITLILFLGIYVLTLLNNLRQIHLSKPIELLRGGQVGEKEPKTKWVLVLIGVATLSYGYYIALVTESPLAAINKFFLAVLLVICGTYTLYTAGTIALLKLLRKKKGLYYQTNYFISISGMLYRMKQNAVGLANICILSTMVLVMLSSTVSLYIGVDDVLAERYPKAIVVKANNLSEKDTKMMEKMIQEEAALFQLTLDTPVSLRSASFPAKRTGNTFKSDQSTLKSFSDLSMIELIPLKDYNRMEGASYTLAEDEVLISSVNGDSINGQMTIGEREFQIKEQITSVSITSDPSNNLTDNYVVVVKDEEMVKDLFPIALNTDWKDLSFFYGFDTNGSSKQEIELTKALTNKLSDASINGHAEGREESREAFYSLYGGLFFLGIFLGTLFIMATVLIMYYKQISEGYDDKQRFAIMQKVGLSKDEIKSSIKSQVLMVFFLPLVTAVIHIAFAFKVITKLLALLNLTNVALFIGCTIATIAVFTLFYACIYALTAREYYKIVS